MVPGDVDVAPDGAGDPAREPGVGPVAVTGAAGRTAGRWRTGTARVVAPTRFRPDRVDRW